VAGCDGEGGTMLRPATGGATLVAHGIGGRLELSRNQLRIIKGGTWGHFVEVLHLGYGMMEKRIFLDQISAVEIVKLIVAPDFIRFSYNGSPATTGHYVDDAFAENALIMNPFDHRKFYALKDRMDQLIARKT
jgi:hypothetical protein